MSIPGLPPEESNTQQQTQAPQGNLLKPEDKKTKNVWSRVFSTAKSSGQTTSPLSTKRFSLILRPFKFLKRLVARKLGLASRKEASSYTIPKGVDVTKLEKVYQEIAKEVDQVSERELTEEVKAAWEPDIQRYGELRQSDKRPEQAQKIVRKQVTETQDPHQGIEASKKYARYEFLRRAKGAGIAITEADLVQYYQDHKTDIIEAVRQGTTIRSDQAAVFSPQDADIEKWILKPEE